MHTHHFIFKMKIARKLFLILLLLAPLAAGATTPLQPPHVLVMQAFRSYKEVTPTVSKTTVVEVSMNDAGFSTSTFAVYNKTSSEFEPYYYLLNEQETNVKITAGGEVDVPSSINDGNYATYFEFPFAGNQSLSTTINFEFEKPITASALDFALDNYVTMPQTIAISAIVANKDYTVLTPIKSTSGHIVFPKTTSNFWQVSFSYIQPLRISEIKFEDLSVAPATKALRFLAQPGQSYQIYFDSDRYIQSSTKESGNLASNEGVVKVTGGATKNNPIYTPLDSDADGIPNFKDNCVNVYNGEQRDEDRNGRGDDCEDYDRDGVYNSTDNCADEPNGNQIDTDADGIGDICDDKDNRVTERLPWLPWAGIGLAGIVVVGLFFMTLKHKEGSMGSQNIPPAPPTQ